MKYLKHLKLDKFYYLRLKCGCKTKQTGGIQYGHT